MGWTDVLFGGLGKSTNPADYAVNSPNQAQMQGMLGQQAAQIDPNQQAQFRQMQMQQAQQLQGIASGQQQGAGELAAQRQVQNALAAQQAQQHMIRGGGNAGLGLLAGARNAAGVGISGAGMGQQAAMQDQQMAQGQLANSLNQGRGGDLQMAGQNAGFQNQRYGENLGALGQNDAQRLAAQQAYMQSTTGQQGILGGLLNTAGTLGGAAIMHSDKKLKKNIRDGGDDIDELMSKLNAKTYSYKDQKHGEGPRTGIMAQDLASSKLGKSAVFKAPDGLALDLNKSISAALAMGARLNERLSKVESTK